jgi:hypothetical protein
MKRILNFLLCLLLCAGVLPAQAHGGYGDYGRGHGHHGGWRNNWAGPVLGAALVGSVIYSASSPSYVMAAPGVMVQPPVYPNRVAYFCNTSQQYYPNVPSCNVPWQLVSY